MIAFGLGASVLGCWRLGGIDTLVLHMQAFYVNWQWLDANMMCYVRALEFDYSVPLEIGFRRRAKIVMPSCPKSNIKLDLLGKAILFTDYVHGVFLAGRNADKGRS